MIHKKNNNNNQGVFLKLLVAAKNWIILTLKVESLAEL